ncbi:LIM domain-containing protein 1-like [Hypomesus transpacificus]|uniref:LIM domain-containing protein 1-like n=1 Tax=Hypomesus transpacificus TaxID=137520 RepID=UPI001F07CD7C|nr:LIM domain-containing protein 1-like [Hypomesus transpacificus]
MDKYDDLGLEASKFIEDLNMYEASRDGLFRMRRDAGNNPDFEETRKVFATKMNKIHMQKQQEEMAKNSLAVRMNGGHHRVTDHTFYTKDRPPINSYRLAGEAAAKPPILSGPMPGAGSQYGPYDGQKHNSGLQHEVVTGRAYNYENKERLEPHSYQQHTTTVLGSGNMTHAVPTYGGHGPASPSGAWGPSQLNQPPQGASYGGSQLPPPQPPPPQPQRHSPSSSFSSTLPAPSSPGPLQRPPAGAVRGWAGESSMTGRPDLIPSLPLSSFTGGAELYLPQPKPQPQPQPQPAPITPLPLASYSPPSTAPRPSTQTDLRYNGQPQPQPQSPGPLSTASAQVAASSPASPPPPSQSAQPRARALAPALAPGAVSTNFLQGRGPSQASQTGPGGPTAPGPEYPQPSPGQVVCSAQPQVQVQPHTLAQAQPQVQPNAQPPRAVRLPCQTLHVQPEQGLSAVELQLEALTQRLENEMDAQPTAEHFGSCVKCDQPVYGASQACQAMGSLYHDYCFTCSACSKLHTPYTHIHTHTYTQHIHTTPAASQPDASGDNQQAADWLSGEPCANWL